MKSKFFKVISFVLAIILIPFISINICAEEVQHESNIVNEQIQSESNSNLSQDYQYNSQSKNENGINDKETSVKEENVDAQEGVETQEGDVDLQEGVETQEGDVDLQEGVDAQEGDVTVGKTDDIKSDGADDMGKFNSKLSVTANDYDFSQKNFLEIIQKYFDFEVDEDKTPYGLLVYQGKHAGYKFSLFYSEEERMIDTILISSIGAGDGLNNKLATVNLSEIKSHLKELKIQNVYFAPDVEEVKNNIFNLVPVFSVEKIVFLTDADGNSSIKKIGNNAFSNVFANDSVITIDLPVGLEKIGNKAFLVDKNKTQVTVRVPYTVTFIAEDAFDGVTNVIMVDRPVEIIEEANNTGEAEEISSKDNTSENEESALKDNEGKFEEVVSKDNIGKTEEITLKNSTSKIVEEYSLNNTNNEMEVDLSKNSSAKNSLINNTQSITDSVENNELSSSVDKAIMNEANTTSISATDIELVNAVFEAAKDGQTITIDMSGASGLKAQSLRLIAGKDVDVILDMGAGNTWQINGLSINADAVNDLDLGFLFGKNTATKIPNAIRKNLVGENDALDLSFTYDGQLGLTATLSLSIDSKYDGKYGNLFYYSPSKNAYEHIESIKVVDGHICFDFSHFSDYTIVFSDDPLQTPKFANGEDVSASELEAHTYNTSSIYILLSVGVIVITAIIFGILFLIKKRKAKGDLAKKRSLGY